MRYLVALFLLCLSYNAFADELDSSIRISSKGMQLQSERLKVISQNIANSNVTGSTPEEDPYSRKVLKVKKVYDKDSGGEITVVDKVAKQKTNYIMKYEPSHPAANAEGYVKYPNVDTVVEMVDAKEAQRTFDANLSAMEIAKSNQAKLVEALK